MNTESKLEKKITFSQKEGDAFNGHFILINNRLKEAFFVTKKRDFILSLYDVNNDEAKEMESFFDQLKQLKKEYPKQNKK